METFICKKDLNEWVAKYFANQDIISIEDLVACIEDLDGEIEHLNEELESKEQYYQDNYKPIDEMTMYGLSESDFH